MHVRAECPAGAVPGFAFCVSPHVTPWPWIALTSM